MNGKDGTGKEYLTDTALLDHKIPFTYLKTFCESQNGRFTQTYQSKFEKLTKPVQGYTNIALPYIGGFTCSTPLSTMGCKLSLFQVDIIEMLNLHLWP